MKRILSLLLIGILVIGLTTGCGNNKKEKSENSNSEESVKNNYTQTIIDSASDYYGKVVKNYKVEGLSEDYEWKIFYADDNNIYLISADYINLDDIPSKNGNNVYHESETNYRFSFYYDENLLKQYSGSDSISEDVKYLMNDYFKYLKENNTTGSTNSLKFVSYLLDTSIWNKFVNTDYADLAIGGPTMKMLIDSYNQKYNTSYKYKVGSSGNYSVNDGKDESFRSHYYDYFNKNDSLYVITSRDKATGTIIVAQGDDNTIFDIDFSGAIDVSSYCKHCNGARPIIRLKKDIKLQRNSDDTYSIINSQENVSESTSATELNVGTYQAKETDGEYVIEIKSDNKCHFKFTNPFYNIDSDGTYTLDNNNIIFKLNSGETINCDFKDSQIFWSEQNMTFYKN